MLSALRRLFRRAPPHLAGRVPVDAGVGVARDDYRIGYGPEIRPVVLSTAAPRQHAELNTFLEREGCIPWSAEEFDRHRAKFTPAPPLPSGARPDWAMRDAERPRQMGETYFDQRTRQLMVATPEGPVVVKSNAELLAAKQRALPEVNTVAASVDRWPDEVKQREMSTVDSSEPQWESGDPRWMAHLRKVAKEAAIRKMTEYVVYGTLAPPNAAQMTLEDFGWPKSCAHGDGCCLPECQPEVRTYRQCEMYKPRPAPAENAKRYTREDGTW